MKPLTTGQGIVYATLIVIGTYIAAWSVLSPSWASVSIGGIHEGS
jgi:hypothetical protein